MRYVRQAYGLLRSHYSVIKMVRKVLVSLGGLAYSASDSLRLFKAVLDSVFACLPAFVK